MQPLQEFKQPALRTLSWSFLLFMVFHSQAKGSSYVVDKSGNSVAYPADTSRRRHSGDPGKQVYYPHRRRGPFFGVWSNYSGSFLTLNPDSTFKFTWGLNWASGKWTRKDDTFYFTGFPVYDSLSSKSAMSNYSESFVLAHKAKPGLTRNLPPAADPRRSIQNQNIVPEALLYSRNRFLPVSFGSNQPHYKTNPPYTEENDFGIKNFYIRNRRFNVGYFDSTYYARIKAKRLKMGFGITGYLQPQPGYRVVGSMGFSLSPRYVLQRNSNSYLTLGMPLTFGFTRRDDSTRIDYVPGVMVHIPLMFNYNYEPARVLDDKNRFSYFVGAGAAYHNIIYTAASAHGTMDNQVNGFGPELNAGIRFSIRKYRLQNMEVKFSYMKMINVAKTDIFGLGYFINF